MCSSTLKKKEQNIYHYTYRFTKITDGIFTLIMLTVLIEKKSITCIK